MKYLTRMAVIFILAATVLTGCGADNAVKDEVTSAMQNFYDIQSGNYEYIMDFKITDAPQNGAFDLALTGSFDNSDPETSYVSLALKGNMDDETMEPQSVAGEMKQIGNDLYFLLEDAPMILTLFVPDLDSYKGKWWKLSLPEESMDSFQRYNKLSSETEDADLTPEEKKIRKMIRDVEYFTDYTKIGEEGGLVEYSVVLNSEEITKLAVELASMSGGGLDKEEIGRLDKVFSSFDEPIYLLVNPEKNVVVDIEAEFEFPFDPDGAEMGTVLLGLDLSLDNIDEPVTIEVPEGAEEFDTSSLFAPAPEASEPQAGKLD